MRSGSADLVGPALTGRGHTDISTQLGEALLTRVSSADVVDGVVTRVYFAVGAPLQAFKDTAATNSSRPTMEMSSMPAPKQVPLPVPLPPGLNAAPRAQKLARTKRTPDA